MLQLVPHRKFIVKSLRCISLPEQSLSQCVTNLSDWFLLFQNPASEESEGEEQEASPLEDAEDNSTQTQIDSKPHDNRALNHIESCDDVLDLSTKHTTPIANKK